MVAARPRNRPASQAAQTAAIVAPHEPPRNHPRSAARRLRRLPARQLPGRPLDLAHACGHRPGRDLPGAAATAAAYPHGRRRQAAHRPPTSPTSGTRTRRPWPGSSSAAASPRSGISRHTPPPYGPAGTAGTISRWSTRAAQPGVPCCLARAYRLPSGQLVLVELKTRWNGAPNFSDVIQLSAQRVALSAAIGQTVAAEAFVLVARPGVRRLPVAHRVDLLSVDQVVALVRRRDAMAPRRVLCGALGKPRSDPTARESILHHEIR